MNNTETKDVMEEYITNVNARCEISFYDCLSEHDSEFQKLKVTFSSPLISDMIQSFMTVQERRCRDRYRRCFASDERYWKYHTALCQGKASSLQETKSPN
jgi:hypothetical protein